MLFQLVKEKKNIEERAAQLTNHLLEEEERAKHVGKQRSRIEMQLQEQEQELKKEKQVNLI